MRNFVFIVLVVFLSSCDKKNHSSSLVSNHTFNIQNDTIKIFGQNNEAITTILIDSVSSYSISSTTHLAFIDKLSERDSSVMKRLVGATNDVIKFANSNYFLDKYNRGEIKNIGNEDNFDLETLSQISVHFSTPIDIPNSNHYIRQTKCRNIPIYDWMEESALARAEWVKVFSALLSKKEYGDSIFTEIEKAYNFEKECNSEKFAGSHKKKVIVGEPYQGIWYVASRDSYIGRLISDAGGEIISPQKDNIGVTYQMEIEQAIMAFKDADVWINTSYSSITDLVRAYPFCKKFKAVKSGNVYNNMKRLRGGVRNDYWESAVINPHLVLRDIKFTFIGETDSMFYFNKLK